MLRNILKILAIFIIGTIGGIFADQIFWPYFVEKPLFYKYRLEQAPIYINERKEIIIQENVALKNAVEKAEKTVVGIKSRLKTGKVLEGSGLVLTSDGLIITLAELVPAGAETTVFWEGDQYKIGAENKILKRGISENLVLIKIDKKNLPTAGFADLSRIKKGERVFLLGVVFEKEIPQKTVNEGIINNLNGTFLQTNIFEDSVISGSPLFDIEVNILGLNTVDKKGRVLTIPISKIRAFAGL